LLRAIRGGKPDLRADSHAVTHCAAQLQKYPVIAGSGDIVLLDTIGELASVYSLASVAFVGGSLIPAGGHNPLEPAQFGAPIVMGPHYFNFRAITEDLLAHNAICITERGNLAKVLVDLLCDRAAAKATGERARQVFASQAGATDRCVEAIEELLSAQNGTERPA
jgi:3-deoxy-D-manno-octulosonic-acid transferase